MDEIIWNYGIGKMQKATRKNVQIHMKKEGSCLSCTEFGNGMLTFRIYSRTTEEKTLKKKTFE